MPTAKELLESLNVTNKQNLPDEVIRAILKDRYNDPNDKPSDFSATGIIAPTQQTILKKRYDAATKDVTDYFWSFMGSVAHQVLEDSWHEGMDSVVEERLYMDVFDKVLSGKIDCYNEGIIQDYKTTKVYKIMKKSFDDWEKQLNVYGGLCQANNLPVNKIEVIALLFDWNKNDIYKKDYPLSPIITIEIPIWTNKQRLEFIQSRVAKLTDAANLSDTELADKYPCSDEDRWINVSGYAVMKEGNKKATKVFEKEEEAIEFAQEKGKEFSVEKRSSGPRRCIEYCDVSYKCVQHEAFMNENYPTGLK